MDQKKNLKPELREIYERVMNTPTGSAKNATSTPQQTPAASKPQQDKSDFLTSVPPHKLENPPGKEFVFSAKNHSAEEKTEHREKPARTMRDPFFNGKMLILGVIFVLVWTAFWLVLLGVVKPTSLGL